MPGKVEGLDRKELYSRKKSKRTSTILNKESNTCFTKEMIIYANSNNKSKVEKKNIIGLEKQQKKNRKKKIRDRETQCCGNNAHHHHAH